MPTITEPLAEVPEMPSLEKEHPEYGTCPHCLQAKRITKSGWLPEHKTGYMVYSPSMKATFECPGSGRRYTEHGDRPKHWDLRAGDWRWFPLEVPVIVRSDDQDGISEPTWRLVEVPASDDFRRAIVELVKGDRFRIEIQVIGKEVFGTLFALGSSVKDGATRPLYEAQARQASIFDHPACEVGRILVGALVPHVDGEV
jgi:hypothetical protein